MYGSVIRLSSSIICQLNNQDRFPVLLQTRRVRASPTQPSGIAAEQPKLIPTATIAFQMCLLGLIPSPGLRLGTSQPAIKISPLLPGAMRFPTWCLRRRPVELFPASSPTCQVPRLSARSSPTVVAPQRQPQTLPAAILWRLPRAPTASPPPPPDSSHQLSPMSSSPSAPLPLPTSVWCN